MKTADRNRGLALFLTISPIIVAVLIMLPRLLSPQFGLFDDGRSMVTAQKVTQGVWDMSVDDFEGRFRPLYWLFFALPYALFGDGPWDSSF